MTLLSEEPVLGPFIVVVLEESGTPSLVGQVRVLVGEFGQNSIGGEAQGKTGGSCRALSNDEWGGMHRAGLSPEGSATSAELRLGVKKEATSATRSCSVAIATSATLHTHRYFLS